MEAHPPLKVHFVENKPIYFDRVEELLQSCRPANRWANRGPVYERMVAEFEEHLAVPSGQKIVPVANGGMALEAMARLHDRLMGRQLRWVGSSFSFKNLGRGYFANMKLLDCDHSGLLSLVHLMDVPVDEYDGIVLTNPFGTLSDYAPYVAFAKDADKVLLVDNAAALMPTVEGPPWQSFSLHQTKPYGMGEGGLALLPADLAEDYYELLNYGERCYGSSDWLQNGKLSDLSCAFHLARLEKVNNWLPDYREQRERIESLSRTCGLTQLGRPPARMPLTSLPCLSPYPVSSCATLSSRKITFGKYYTPLEDHPVVSDLFKCLINIPCHPDMREVRDSQIIEEIEQCLKYDSMLATAN